MKRRAFKLLLFLLAGAIINVAVAWGYAVLTNPFAHAPDGYGFTGTAQLVWKYDLFQHSGMTVVRRTAFDMSNAEEVAAMRHYFNPDEDTPLPYWSIALGNHPVRQTTPYENHYELTTGVPMRALRCQFFQAGLGIPFDHFKFGLCVQHSKGFDTPLIALPLFPIWPGFAINTIFYAAVTGGGWVLFAVPGAVRRRLRRKRGQCASCGHSRRGTPQSEKCPECGATAFQYRDRHGAAA